MAGVTLTPTEVVNLQASFNKWCGDCNPLADPSKTGVWSVTLPLAPGDYQYKYTTNGWTGQAEAVPLACDITGGAQHNRGFTLATEPLTLAVKWGACPVP
jgi:1,4-alpha-glucan branching enzyme